MADRAPPILPVDPEAKTRRAADLGRIVEALQSQTAPLPAAPLIGLCYEGVTREALRCSLTGACLDFYALDLSDIAKNNRRRELHDDNGRVIGEASVELRADSDQIEILLWLHPEP